MNTLLQERLASLGNAQMPMMMAEGGEVDTNPLDLQDPQVQADIAVSAEMPTDPQAGLRQTIAELMNTAATAEDPLDAAVATGLAQAAEVGTQAPMADMAVQLSQAGRGPDTTLAHLAPGEVVLPPQMMADADFERTVGERFEELDLDPEQYVVGSGIASLNPITGLEEFGWFKKTWKSVKKVGKKVIKPIADVAQFIPGPWQPYAAMISKGYAAYDSFKAGNPVAGIMALGAPMPGGKGGFSIPGFGGGTFSFPGGGSTSGGGIGDLLSGAGDFFMGSGRFDTDGKGFLTNLGDFITGRTPSEVLGELGAKDPAFQKIIDDMVSSRGLTPEQILEELQRSGQISPYAGQNILGRVGEFVLPGLDNQGLFANTNKFLGGMGGGQQGQMSPGDYLASGFGGMGGGGSGFPGGMLGAAGLAGLIGKLVYDNTKNMKGVPLTPLTQMNAAGRYNIEAEIARRMGQPAPNPVEFGLLPQGTMPQLIGGSTGPVQGYKDGGNVDSAMFVRMTGDIGGPGSEVSDDIPAMLSDGEFVMTGRAVRGAGAFDMKNKNGVLTLTPSKEEDRDRGTDLMYEMMDVFAGRASPPPAGQGA